MRELFLKLSPSAQQSLANLLEAECLPAMERRKAEYLAALNTQADSADCIRGLIALAHAKEAA